VKIFHSLPVFMPEERERPVALALGQFDGVHLGHRAMLHRVREAAEDLNLVPAVLTFEPSPSSFFLKENAPPQLASWQDRLKMMENCGIERAYVLPFDEKIANLPAEDFADEFLAKLLHVEWLLLTDDSRFGKDRRGSLAFLRARRNAFAVETLDFALFDGERVSSTRVRRALAKSDFSTAQQLLGYPYSIGGRVKHGDKRGRTLGFPTMNLPLTIRPPVAGVFAVRVFGLGEALNGVASLGYRPTFKGEEKQPVLEIHLFDFNEDVYGREIRVEFIAKLRDEKKFDSVDELVAQMEKDAAVARRYLADPAR
jgi:riboflavin kinase/FMN adenylyltransferase